MEEKGISLISLVVIIIILLIFAGITIEILSNTGIIDRAQTATNEYSQAQTNESKLIYNSIDIIDEVSPEIKVGDYIEYAPTHNELSQETVNLLQSSSNGAMENYVEECNLKQEKLYWRVLDIKDGKIRLISDAPTQAIIDLYGYKGYNNIVYLFNLVCSELYSSEVGKAKSLTIDDIQDHLSYDYTNYTIYGQYGHKYGDVFTIDDPLNKYYPEIYLSEIGSGQSSATLNQSEQLSLVNQTEEIQGDYNFTVSEWSKELKPEDFLDYNNGISKYYNVLFENDNSSRGYVLASRCVDELDELTYKRAVFGVYWISNRHVVAQSPMYDSRKQSNGLGLNFKPVVTLNEGVKIQKCQGQNSKENMHKIIN